MKNCEKRTQKLTPNLWFGKKNLLALMHVFVNKFRYRQKLSYVLSVNAIKEETVLL